jgi:hypothetical protein
MSFLFIPVFPPRTSAPSVVNRFLHFCSPSAFGMTNRLVSPAIFSRLSVSSGREFCRLYGWIVRECALTPIELSDL